MPSLIQLFVYIFRVILYDQLDGFLYQFRDKSQVLKLFLAFLHFFGLEGLLEDDELLGFLGSQSFHDWLGINHPEVISQDDYTGVLSKTNHWDAKTKAFAKALFTQAVDAFEEPFK